ncbi:hypothetical protein [Campylobacter cuniculorum]|nr:hypothetical protein [Campylobacter cuniculorum]
MIYPLKTQQFRIYALINVLKHKEKFKKLDFIRKNFKEEFDCSCELS